jgi:hypothetical protein
MNATIEERLRRHYDERTREIPAHGPGIGAEALPQITFQRAAAWPRVRRATWATLAIGSVTAAALLGFVLISRPTTEQLDSAGSDVPSSATSVTSDSTADVDALQPVQTLPDGGDVSDTPATVVAAAPVDWYRLQPDLDVAWHLDPSGQSPSMLCWRTPVGSECFPDDLPDDALGALPLIVPTGGGQTLVVTIVDAGTTDLEVRLTGGTVMTAPVVVDDTIGWSVARYVVPAGQFITRVGDIEVDARDEIISTIDPAEPPTGSTAVPTTDPDTPADPRSGWERLPDPPLSARTDAIVADLDGRIIVMGGTTFLCGPDERCTGGDTDGATFDPGTGVWEPITPAPARVSGECRR